jgi:Domain of Unknown Function (DUF1080)
MTQMKLLTGGFLLLSATGFAADKQFKPLFNGRDLSGWQEDTPNIWSVRDGMIVGRTPGMKHNDFLRTKKTYGEFVLKVRFRLIDGQGNAGIQFRSEAVPDSHEVSGYQADIGQEYWGCLYDESRRNQVLAKPSPGMLEGLRKDGWNEYVITARGKVVTLDLNGKRTVNWVESAPGIKESGFIALQVHGGPPMEVQYKDIVIQEFK